MKRRVLFTLVAVLLAAPLALTAPAADKAEEQREALKKVQDASNVITAIMRADDKAIPRELLADAECVAVFPGVIKGAFIIGGSGGSGCAVCRDPRTGRWEQPLFLKIRGGSVGFQIGGSKTDFVLMGVNREAQQALIKGEFTLGADAAVAGGPVGRSAKAGTDWKLDSQFLAYSRSKGAFAGIALDGSKIVIDKDRNHAVYGDAATPQQIITGEAKPDPKMATRLTTLGRTLARYSPAKPDR